MINICSDSSGRRGKEGGGRRESEGFTKDQVFQNTLEMKLD